MADIVLTALNAKYIHAAFGLRYLLANLGELKPRACPLDSIMNLDYDFSQWNSGLYLHRLAAQGEKIVRQHPQIQASPKAVSHD